jgi:hypothetical protein
MGKIFVQIASYRDPELRPTLKDLFEKADKPDNLKVCVAWQHSSDDKWDTLDEYINDDRVIILDIPYSESEGACWARNLIQQQYRGEKYTLQLDSHHRFIQGWDTELIKMYEDLRKDGVEKPLLTAYIPSYDPKNDPEGRAQDPWKMHFDRFTPEGVVFFRPGTIDDWKERDKPIPGRFYSAHFTFTSGKHCREVTHDPDYYFHGEEISLALRSYTHGYDIFHPHKVIAWHEYTREGRTKHWDDNNWDAKNRSTHEKMRELLGVDTGTPVDQGKYGLGKVRTIADYEKYAGIRFKDRRVQQHTLEFALPPNPTYGTEEEYEASFLSRFAHYLDIWKGVLHEDDYEFWAIVFEKEDGTPVHRCDADEEEVKNLMKRKGDFVTVFREYIGEYPDKWVVWPFSKSKGWCDRIENKLTP